MTNLIIWEPSSVRNLSALEGWKISETKLERLVKSIKSVELDASGREFVRHLNSSAPRGLNPAPVHGTEPGFLNISLTDVDESSLEVAIDAPAVMSMTPVRYATDIETDAHQVSPRVPTSVRTEFDGAAPIFKILEEWTGTVTNVDKSSGTFSARLISSTQTRDEIGDFLIGEVSDDDHELIAEGAIFYWSVGYETARSRQRSTVSTIRFRRLHFWKRPQMEQALERAKDLAAWFEQD